MGLYTADHAGIVVRMFIWIFHRLSGVLLIFLLVFQLSTGFFQASSSQSEWVRTAAALHRHPPLVCLLVFLVVFHGLYGLRTILLDLGLKREKLLFWLFTLLGSVCYGGFLVLYWTQIAP
jgi:succinate dehydrogenase cytochrome b556 subunit